jgi:toxin CptA
MKSAPAIAFDYRPSRRVAIAVVGVAALAILAVFLSGLSLGMRLVLALAALVLTVPALRKHLRPSTRRVAHGAGGWLLVDGEGNERSARLVAHVQRGNLLLLEFRAEEQSGHQRILLTTDNSDADLRRRLILVLAATVRASNPIG